MLLLIDNFDSFTFNLVQSLEMLGSEVLVVRNDQMDLEQCLALIPSHLVIGPGPGAPKDAGISKSLIRAFEGIIPILGICLGHQCIGELYGGSIIRAPQGPMHGKVSRIMHCNEGVFSGLPSDFWATRYHSLVVDSHSLPNCIGVTATTEDGEIMGIRHHLFTIEGVQFHPESVLTKYGVDLLKNFLGTTV